MSHEPRDEQRTVRVGQVFRRKRQVGKVVASVVQGHDDHDQSP